MMTLLGLIGLGGDMFLSIHQSVGAQCLDVYRGCIQEKLCVATTSCAQSTPCIDLQQCKQFKQPAPQMIWQGATPEPDIGSRLEPRGR
jgi:hypothetical protein